MWKTMTSAALFAATVFALVEPAIAAGPGGFARNLMSHSAMEMVVAEKQATPFAGARICAGDAITCAAERPAVIVLTSFRTAQLKRVNNAVNQAMTPRFDMWGAGIWQVDVENSDANAAVAKREKLLALGWNGKGLSIKTVRDSFGERRAVLVVKTSKGEFVLDDRTDAIKSWSLSAANQVTARRPIAL